MGGRSTVVAACASMPTNTWATDEDAAVRLVVQALLISWLLVATATAVELTNLFDSQVKVADQSDKARAMGEREALADVLVRVSGSATVLDNPVVKEQLGRASEFVIQFSYGEAVDGQLPLLLRFDSARVDRLLRQANEPQWGPRRPQLLLWWVHESGAGRQVVSEGAAPEVWQALSAASVRRGVPLLLPLMDLEDSMEVTTADLWGQFLQPVLTASQRYRPDMVVIAKSYASGGSNRLDWSLYPAAADATAKAQSSGSFSYSAAAPIELLDQLAEKLAAIYAVRVSSGGSGEVMTLTLTDIASVADLAVAQRQLASLSAVSRVEVAALRGREVEFRLHLLGNEQDVLRALSLDHHFSDDFGQPAANGSAPAPEAPTATAPATPTPATSPEGSIELVAPEAASATQPAADAAPVAAPASAAEPAATAATPAGLRLRWVP